MSPKAQRTHTTGEAVHAHGPRSAKPLRAVFLERATQALADLADRLDTVELERAIAGDSRADTLVRALSQPGAIGFVRPEVDAFARARVRGLQRRDELLAGEGGTLTTEAVARHLGLSPQAVHKRRNAGKLLALELGRRGLRFPAWQFADEGVLPGFEEVLRALEDAPPLAVVRFFLSGNARLAGKRPLDRLRHGDPAPVIAAAQAFDVHGAA